MITLTLPVTDEEKTQLGGESERNFVRLEQVMKVRLFTRNPGISIQADDEAVAKRARTALEKMAGALKTGRQLPEFYLDDLLGTLKASPNGENSAPILDKPILMDRFGHPVQPKTRGQARFIQVIKEHDMVFAAGPAGTGCGTVMAWWCVEK